MRSFWLPLAVCGGWKFRLLQCAQQELVVTRELRSSQPCKHCLNLLATRKGEQCAAPVGVHHVLQEAEVRKPELKVRIGRQQLAQLAAEVSNALCIRLLRA